MENELTPSWFIGIDWTGAETRRNAIAERFELNVPIGRGGSAEVWRAHDPTTEEHVAIKVLVHEVARQPLFQSQLRHEVRAVSRLWHERIVRVLDVGTLGPEVERATEGRLVAGSPFVAMELLRGGTLLPLIHRPRPWSVLRVVFERLLEALAHAHSRGVLHLDIKPSNVMRRTGADDDVVLTDFGIACFTHEPAPAGTGTEGYAAPEQVIGDGRDVGPATDLFSFGCVAWELLTGHSPFVEEEPHARAFASPRAFAPRLEVPGGVEAWLLALLRSSPRARVGSAHRALRTLPGAIPDAPGLSDWRGSTPTGTPGTSRLAFGLGLWGLGIVPIVGREQERDVAWKAARRGLEAGPVLLDIVGPPGSGKSRLASWLLTRLAEFDAATTLHVAAAAGESLAEVLRRHFRTDGLALHRATLRIEDVIGPHWVVPEAAAVLSGETDDPSALGPLLERMNDVRPVVLCLDASEEPSPHFHGLLVRTLEHATAPPAHFRGQSFEVSLAPLSEADKRRLLEGVLRLGPIARAQLDALTPWPGMLLAQVAKWVEAGELERQGDEFELSLAARRTAAELPLDDVSELWAERLDGLARRLSEGETRALEVAAVLGSGAELRLWALAATKAGAKPTLASVDRLAMEGLGELRDDKLLFAGAAIVEALKRRAVHRLSSHHRACAHALGELVPRVRSPFRVFQRRNADGCVAQALRASSTCRSTSSSGRLALDAPASEQPGTDFGHAVLGHVRRAVERRGLHFLAAGDGDEAKPLLLAGARARARALDPQRALELLDLYEHQLEADGRGELDFSRVDAMLERSLCLRRLGRNEQATELAKAAHRGARKLASAPLHARAAHLRGRLARAAGDTTAAMRYLVEAKAAAERGHDARLAADIDIDMAVVLLSVGALERARQELTRVLESDERPEARAMALLLCARIDRRQHRLDEGRGRLEEAKVVLPPGARGLLPELWNEAAEIERAAGGFREAEGLYRRALEGYVALGSAAAPTELNLGLTLIELGDLEGATTHIEGALGAWSAQGREDLAGGWALAAAFGAARGGDWEQSRQLLERVQSLDDDDWRHLHARMAALAEAPPEVTRRLVELGSFNG